MLIASRNQSLHLKRWFFIKDRPIYFQINKTKWDLLAIRLTNYFLFTVSLVRSHIKVQILTLAVITNKKAHQTSSWEWLHEDDSITDYIIRNIINVQTLFKKMLLQKCSIQNHQKSSLTVKWQNKATTQLEIP